MIHIKHIYKNFFASCVRECEWEKKTEQNYLNGSAFAMVFLRAKDAGAAVLHMLF